MKSFLLGLAGVLVCSSGVNRVAAVSSPGCGKALASDLTQGGVGKSNSLKFKLANGTSRSYLLHIPSSYDKNKAAPLVWSFHGHGSDAAAQEESSQLSRQSWNPNMLVVYPEGIKQQWQGDPRAVGYNDTGFVLELQAHLENKYCIDTTKVYTSGRSNGGGFSLNVLACDPVASTRFAAFSACSGAYYQGSSDKDCHPDTVATPCNPGRTKIPILEFHGVEDHTIPYAGGQRQNRCLPSINHYFENKAYIDGLSTAVDAKFIDDLNSTYYSFGKHDSTRGLVSHYEVGGLAHKWTSIKNGAAFDATPKIIEFFNKYTLPAQ